MRPPRTYVLPRKEIAQADHLFLAKATGERGAVDRMLCSLLLPRNDQDRITLSFFPTVEQAMALQHVRTFALSGKHRSRDQAYSIEASEVWSSGISNGFMDGISYMSSFQGTPRELEITTLLERRRGEFISSGVFRMSDCPIINAASIISQSYTGNVRVKRVVVPSFKLKSGIRLRFKDHFDSFEDELGENSTTRHLAAEFRTTRRIPICEFPEVKRDFDKFLLLASLASRYRCVCPRWTYSDDRNNIVVHYYQNLVTPQRRAPAISEALIDISLFPKFIRRAYESYSKSPQPELIDNAICALVNERASLEDRYTRLFTGLQSLLWFSYRTGGGTKPRVPIKELYKKFVARHRLMIDDLWPLFDEASGPSLYAIRNHIAHGEFLDPAKFIAVSCAQENLRWAVERIILTILGWPVEQSHAGPDYLKGWSRAYDWAPIRSQW